MALTPDFAGVRADVSAGFDRWRVWTRSGWHEVKRRYQRTVLGPFWNTMSLAALAFAMAYIWAPLMGADLPTFLPWVLSGVVCWTFISTLINAGGTIWTSAEGLLKQLRFPMTAILMTTIWREIIIFFHNLIVVVLVMLILSVPINANSWLFFPGLVLVVLNAFWFIPFLGLLSARFRDVPPLISSVLTVLYFVTPVFWRPEQLAGRTWLYDVNPMHHLLDVLRSPLMGKAPETSSYLVVLTMILVGYGMTFIAFAYLKRRVTYWL